MLPAFLTTILFSVSAVCAQRSSRALGGIEANFWRVLLATFFLGIYAHCFGQGWRGHAFAIYFASGTVGFGLGDTALYQALPRIGSRLSILLVHCLAAPVAATVEWLWLGHALSAREILAALLILTGVAVALAPGHHLEIPRPTFWAGVILAGLAAVGQGIGAVLSRRAVTMSAAAQDEIDGLTAAYQRIIAGLIVAALFFAMTKWRNASGNAPPSTLRRARIWPWIFVNALSGPALGVGCYQWALMRQGTGVVLPIVALTPLVIIPFSRFIEGERPTKRSIVGGIIAVLGAVVLASAVAAK